MKQWIVMMLCTLLGLYSCNKDTKTSAEPVEPKWGADSASVIINDSITWTANGSRNGIINDTIFWMTLDENRQISNGEIYPFEIFSFKMLRKNMSVQKLDSTGFLPSSIITKPTVVFYDKINYDAGNETFEVYRPDSANNRIQITEQRNNYKEIKGIFSVTLIKTQIGAVYIYPDTLRIRNGYFRVTMKE